MWIVYYTCTWTYIERMFCLLKLETHLLANFEVLEISYSLD